MVQGTLGRRSSFFSETVAARKPVAATGGGRRIPMRHLSHVTPALVVGLLTLAWPTLAQAPPSGPNPTCHSRSDLTAMLNQRYAELPSALGVQADGQLVEVFVSENGTSWTIVLTRPDGLSCIVAVGQHWESLPGAINRPLA
jgi:hypothetical protein